MKESQIQRPSTATLILDSAERLVQIRGFNAFSYADIAEELKMTKAALHYHFVGKSELGEALISRYTWSFVESLSAIEAELLDAPARLSAYADLYLEVLLQKKMCLCGMLAADFETLSEPMRAGVVAFFDENRTWLSRVLKDGVRKGTLNLEDSPAHVAQMIISSLQGAVLIARPYGDPSIFKSLAPQIIKSLKAKSGIK